MSKKKCPVCQSPVSVLKQGFDAYQQWSGLVTTYVHKRLDGRTGCGLCGAVWQPERKVWWPIRFGLSKRSTRGALEIGYCEETSKDIRGRRFGKGIGWGRLRLLFGRGW